MIFFSSCENSEKSKMIFTKPFSPSKLIVRAADQDLIFVGTDLECLYVNAKSLEVLWRIALPSPNNVYCIDKNEKVFIFSAPFEENLINNLNIIDIHSGDLKEFKAFNTEFDYQYSHCYSVGESVVLSDNDSYTKFNNTSGEIIKSEVIPKSVDIKLIEHLKSSLNNQGTLIWKSDMVIYETDSFKIVSGSKGMALNKVTDKLVQWELLFESKISVIDINPNYLLFWFYKDGIKKIGVLKLSTGELSVEKEIPLDFKAHIDDKFLVLIESMEKVELFSLTENNLKLSNKSKIIKGNYIDALIVDNNLVLFENTGQLTSISLNDRLTSGAIPELKDLEID